MKSSLLYRNFLNWRPLGSLIAWSGFPLVFQIAALAGMVLLGVNGWGVGLDQGADGLMTLRKTNLTTLVVWGIWWPVMIALAVFVGRAWCTVCPMELVSRLGDTLARKVGWPRARLTTFLKAGWLVLAAYLVLQLLVAGLSIHRLPHYTSLMLIALGGLAFLSGLVFSHPRAFCVAVCPASALLSVYGRFTPLQLNRPDPSVCAECKSRECVKNVNRYRFDKRSCPSLVRPYDRQQSDGCVLCFQCAKVCPQENIGFGLVRPGVEVRRQRLLRPFEAGFVMVAAGFVSHELIGEVKWLDQLFHFIPARLQSLAPGIGFGWFEALWFLAIFPILLWSVIALLARGLGHRGSLGDLFLRAATGAAPVVALAHLAKAAAKVGSWGGYLPGAMRDPQGLETFGRLTEKLQPAPASLFGLSIVGWMVLLGVALIAWRALAWIRRDYERVDLPALHAGLASAGLFFTVILVIWTRS